ELIVGGLAQWRRLGVLLMVALADVGVGEHVEPLGVGRHETVLDAVVHHLDEVAGAAGPAVQVAQVGGAAGSIAARASLAAGGRGDVAATGSEGAEDGVKTLHDVV